MPYIIYFKWDRHEIIYCTFNLPLIIYFENIPALPLDIEWWPPYFIYNTPPLHNMKLFEKFEYSVLYMNTLCICAVAFSLYFVSLTIF